MASSCSRGGKGKDAPEKVAPPMPRRHDCLRSRDRPSPDATSSDGLRLVGWYAWIIHRAGAPLGFTSVLTLVLLFAAKLELWEQAWADDERINSTSVQVVCNLTSLVLALTVSFSMEGVQVVDRLLNCHSFGQFLVAALLFTLASYLIIAAFRMGVSSILVATLGYLYLPIAAMFSVAAFPRRYGVLEWVSLAMITLATISLLLLRERNKWLHKSGGGPAQVGTHVLSERETKEASRQRSEGSYFDFMQVEGIAFVLIAVTISALGSILAERIYKGRPFCLRGAEAQGDDFYVNKVHIDLASLMFSLILWVAPLSLVNIVPVLSYSEQWFGPWTWHQIVMVLIAVAQSWLAGLVVKRFSTVCKSIAQTLSLLLAGVLGDPVLNRYDFSSRAAPTIALAVIIMLSAAIFQTGRIQRRVFVKRYEQRLAQDPQSSRSPVLDDIDGRREVAEQWSIILSPQPAAAKRGKLANGTLSQVGRDGARIAGRAADASEQPAGATTCQQHTEKFIAHTLTVAYVGVFVVENLAKQYALSKTMIVMGTMNLMTFVVGACLASCMTLWQEGFQLLTKAWHPWQIVKFLPCGVLFAVSQAMVFSAYALHVPASIVTVLGFVYTPISALGKRCILGKVTMWLQWVALLITTLASMTFGFLQNAAPAHGAESVGMLGLVCVIVSAALAAFGSLAMEKFLKDEKDSFYVQKVSLDVGSVLTSLALLPLSGVMSERPRDAFWRDRPLGECLDDHCWGEVGSNWTCAANSCSCECSSGLFVAWDSYLVWFTLLVVIARGWFKGQVTKITSTLEVAIAESFGPLLIYFIGEPILFGKMLNDWALNSVVFIAPLSAVVFTVSEEEQKGFMQRLKSQCARYSVAADVDEEQLCPLEAILENLDSAIRQEFSEESDNSEEQEESPFPDARFWFGAIDPAQVSEEPSMEETRAAVGEDAFGLYLELCQHAGMEQHETNGDD